MDPDPPEVSVRLRRRSIGGITELTATARGALAIAAIKWLLVAAALLAVLGVAAGWIRENGAAGGSGAQLFKRGVDRIQAGAP